MTKAIWLLGMFVMISVARCKKSAHDFNSDSYWYVESYDNGVITVQHEGNTYKGTCDISRSFNNASSITDPSDVHEFTTCDMAIKFVGHHVQPFEGTQKDADGWTVNMWNVGQMLALRSWHDEHTPWRQEEFKITSVTRNAP